MLVTSTFRYSYFLRLVNPLWIPVSPGFSTMSGIDLEMQYNVKNLTPTSILRFLDSTGNVAARHAYSVGLSLVRLSGRVR